MRWLYYILPFFILLLACQKEISGGETPPMVLLKFYTTYQPIEGVKVYINHGEFTKLRFYDTEPSCSDSTFEGFPVAPGREYIISYAGNDLDSTMTIDTPIVIPSWVRDCHFANLNN